MLIGKITFKVENAGGNRYFYCRPVASADKIFPTRIGFSHVVYVEKNNLSKDYILNETYTTHALFLKKVIQEEFDNHVCVTKIIPISEEAFNVLKTDIENINDKEHAFRVD
jgi:hypothetical protein